MGLFFWRLDARDLWSSHEARAAMDAQQWLDTGGLPRLYDGRPETQKPPLYYWLVAGVARLRGGVDTLAVRLPAALAAVLTVAVVVLLGVAWGDPLAGLLAGLVLATSIHFPWLARIGRVDMPLTLTTTAAAAALVLGMSSCRRGLLVVGYLAGAAGVLLKGPIGLLMPLALVAGWMLAEGRWPAFWELAAWRRRLAQTGAWWGVPLVLAVTVPLFLWADRASDGRFTAEFFWLHNVQRGLGGSRLRAHPWWLYVPYLLLYLLPYSPLLLSGLFSRCWREDRLARLGLAWLVAGVVLLSAARFKRADYLLPAYPGAALFVGCVLARAWRRWPAARAGVVAVALAGVVCWAVRLNCGLVEEEPYRDYRRFAAAVRARAPAPAEVVFFRTEAHALAFRVGRPLVVLVEWPTLQARVRRPDEHYVVLPASLVGAARRALTDANVEEVCRNTALSGGRHERPLVLLRVRPALEAIPHAAHTRTPANRRTAAQRPAAGP